VSKKKGWGDTVLGWFVEQGEDDAERALQAARSEPEPDPEPEPGPEPEPAAAAAQKDAPRNPIQLTGDVPAPEAGGTLDFTAVFRAAGLSQEAQDRVEKSTNLLGTLPADAPQQTKRQIVEAALKAFGYPVEQIISASVGEIQALQAFIELGQRNTEKIVTESNQQIEALSLEMTQIRERMQQKLAAQTRLTAVCNQQKLRVQEVLEFFGQEAVASVVSQAGRTDAGDPPR